jgi:hypothetical protein
MAHSSSSDLQDIFRKFCKSRITQQELNILLNHYTLIYRYKYSSLSEDDIHGCIIEALSKLKKTPITNSLQNVNLMAYFNVTLNNVFSEEFRKLPDANYFSRIKGVLKDFKSHFNTSSRKKGSQINWVLDTWQPDSWTERAPCISDAELVELEIKASSFKELNIRIGEQNAISEKAPCLIHTHDIEKFICHLFNLTKALFITGRSMRATDLKQILCTKLGMIPIYPASYLHESDKDNEDDKNSRIWEEIPDDKSYSLELMDLKGILTGCVRQNPTDIKLWLLFKLAEEPKTSLSELVAEQVFSKTLKNLRKSAIDRKKSELAEFIQKHSINLQERGTRDVILSVLGKHFEKNKFIGV